MNNIKEILNELLEEAIYADNATNNLEDRPVREEKIREFELRAEYEFYMIAHDLLKNITKENIKEAKSFIRGLNTKNIYSPEYKVKIIIEKRIEEVVLNEI